MSMHYWKVTLKCTSPVCIGSGETCKKSQYIYDRNERKVYFLREEKWISFLWQNQIMDHFTQCLLKDPVHFNLYDYLNSLSTLSEKYGDINQIIYQMKKDGVVEKEALYINRGANDKNINNDIVRFQYDAEGNPYIPGSSLKGSLRTAIFSHVIRKNRKNFAREWSEIENISQNLRHIEMWNKRTEPRKKRQIRKAIRDCSNQMGRVMDNLEKKIALAPCDEGKCENEKRYFQGLTISDAVLLQGGTCIVPKLDLSINKWNVHQIKGLFREALQADSVLECTIGIDDDRDKMGHLGVRNFSDLQEILEEFNRFQYDMLKNPFLKNAKDELLDLLDFKKVNLRLGAGTGFLDKTLLYSLAPDKESAVAVTKAFMEKTFSEGKHGRELPISPHTIDLVYKDNYTYLMGLCHLEAKPLC